MGFLEYLDVKTSWLDKTRPELLLHPNIPKPLHGVNPRTVLGDAWWKKEKGVVHNKYGNICWACGETHTVYNVHETYKIDYIKCTSTYIESVLLCVDCHMYVHSGLMERLVLTGKMTVDERNRRLDLGDKLIEDIDRLPDDYLVECKCKWSEWRLVIDGKSHKPKFKCEREWAEFYSSV